MNRSIQPAVIAPGAPLPGQRLAMDAPAPFAPPHPQPLTSRLRAPPAELCALAATAAAKPLTRTTKGISRRATLLLLGQSQSSSNRSSGAIQLYV